MFSKPIIRLIGIVVLIIAIIALVTWYFWTRTQSLTTTLPSSTTSIDTTTAPTENKAVIVGAATSEGILGPLQTARFVAERFASYSSEANFSNIESLYPVFTKELKDWAKGYVTQQRAKVISDATPYRVESRVVGTIAKTESDTNAQYTLLLQRQEQRGVDAPKILQQNLIVELIKTNNVWLIDNLKWEP